ncbi:MAG: polysaccharide biosynthesis C-terminal domain-containing protein [Ignavibacteria bacterium]|nr:polysaccharide biosynthesis C-terminal domain-containing protein [Ignavibacteria bacterium]
MHGVHSSLITQKEKNAKEIFAKVLTAFVIVGSFIVLLLSVFITDIVKAELPFGFHLIGKDYWGGLDIVPIILFSYLFYGMYINFMAGIYIEKKTSYLSLIALIGAALNIAGIFLLYPVLGLQGVAVATLLSYVVMMASIYFVSNKFYPVKYEWGGSSRSLA